MSHIHSFLYGILLLVVVRGMYRLLRGRIIDKIPGPPPASWLTGNLPDTLRSEQISDAPFAWTKKYGTVVRMYAEFGRKVLFVSDPKAIQHVLNSGYEFPKPLSARVGSSLVLGRGLFYTDGPQHTQQRKIMSPAFSFNALREFIPLFRHKALQSSNKLKKGI